MRRFSVSMLLCAVFVISIACGGGDSGGNEVVPDEKVIYLSDLEAISGVEFAGFYFGEMGFFGDPGLSNGDIVIKRPSWVSENGWDPGFIIEISPLILKNDNGPVFDSSYGYDYISLVEAYDLIDMEVQGDLESMDGYQNDRERGNPYGKTAGEPDKEISGLGYDISGETYSEGDATVTFNTGVLDFDGDCNLNIQRPESALAVIESFQCALQGSFNFEIDADVVTSSNSVQRTLPLFTQMFVLSGPDDVPVALLIDFTARVETSGCTNVDTNFSYQGHVDFDETVDFSGSSGWTNTDSGIIGSAMSNIDPGPNSTQLCEPSLEIRAFAIAVIGGRDAGAFSFTLDSDSTVWLEEGSIMSPDMTVTGRDVSMQTDALFQYEWGMQNWAAVGSFVPAWNPEVTGNFMTAAPLTYDVTEYPIWGHVQDYGGDDYRIESGAYGSDINADGTFVFYVDSAGTYTVSHTNSDITFFVNPASQDCTVSYHGVPAPLTFTEVPAAILKAGKR